MWNISKPPVEPLLITGSKTSNFLNEPQLKFLRLK